MGISFSASDRLAITRRQVKISIENEALQTTENAFNSQQASLLQVDQTNQKFFDHFHNLCNRYELEARQLNGQIADTFSNSDLIAAAQNPSNPPFFPTSPLPAYTRNIPLIADGSHVNNKVKGFFHPIGTDARRELNILTNSVVFDGLQEMINRLDNGITSSTPTTQTTNTSIPAGVVTNVVLTVSSSSGFSVGELVYIYTTSASGIYIINSLTPTTITVSSVVHTQIGLSGVLTIKNNVPAFTATERETLTSTLYQEILTNITNRIYDLVNEWEGKIDLQITHLTANDDDRSPYNTQNSTALTNVNNTKSTVATWKSLPNTGPTGKYTSTSISSISSMITTRLSYIPTRISQITAALGSSSAQALTQSGDTFNTSVPNNPYYNRYLWLNFRINRLSGSLRRYYSVDQSKAAVQSLKGDNLAIQGAYDAYFITSRITFNDGSNIIHVQSNANFNVGDNIIIVSETKPEINRTIQEILGSTQLKLNAPVPKDYTLEDLARIFKQV